VRGRRKNGTTFPLHLSVSEFSAEGQRYFTGMIHDLSDRVHVEEALRESQRRLAQAQKMEAVGQLTGGIAHDFNNLLLVITGNNELLEPQLDRPEQKELLKEAQDAALLGSKLTDQLLTFARRRHMDAQTIQLNDHVVGVTDMLRRTIGEHLCCQRRSPVTSGQSGPIRVSFRVPLSTWRSMREMPCRRAASWSSRRATSCLTRITAISIQNSGPVNTCS
jgi:C4-dicarboxylate-specific signal transduction histidine kinase